MRATELRNQLNQLIQEFGDGDLVIPDQLEPTWDRAVGTVQYDRQREVYRLSAERV